MLKILYVDLPFRQLKGGDKNRSNFLWDTLSRATVADLLLLKSREYAFKPIPPHEGYVQTFSLVCRGSHPFRARAIHHFDAAQKKKFREVLQRRGYDVIVFRFLSCIELAQEAEQTLPNARIIIDVDMLFSRISSLAWEADPGVRNRYHFLEMQKLKLMEAAAFKRDYLFLFTNPIEMQLAISSYRLDPDNAAILPNMMPPALDQPPVELEAAQNALLFFGTLNSVANQDAYRMLCEEIYPLIEEELERQNLEIHVVGKDPVGLHEKLLPARVKVIGAVEDIRSYIASCRFVILPLRIASGTRTRILEAAELKKAVITTSIGVEGFSFGEDSILIKDSAEALAREIVGLINDPTRALRMGEALYNEACRAYSPQAVGERFVDLLEKPPRQTEQEPQKKRLKLAIVTNRFYPEIGGAETNIYYQAKHLARVYDVTVFCPRRSKTALQREELHGFKIRRLWDALNLPPEYPNLKAKTLCPRLVFELLSGEYDIIQCFPALNYNNYLAFIAAKLRGIAFVLCFFDFVDYAGIIAREGKIAPHLLQNLKLKWHEKLVLRGMDHGFAIAQKEIDFLKQYNPNISYSPVPILSEEYDVATVDPRAGRGISEDEFVFLCLGRISGIKGQDIALQAFASVADSLSAARLVFVGRTDYEPGFYKDLEEMVESRGLAGRVLFTGVLEREEVLGWLRYSDIHVIPVRFMNSGAVVVESWISDTPVLQSDVVDPNLVIDGVNGYLFESENIHACAEAMLRAYEQRDKLPELAAKGKDLVLEKYTYGYLTALYRRVYTKLSLQKGLL